MEMRFTVKYEEEEERHTLAVYTKEISRNGRDIMIKLLCFSKNTLFGNSFTWNQLIERNTICTYCKDIDFKRQRL